MAIPVVLSADTATALVAKHISVRIVIFNTRWNGPLQAVFHMRLAMMPLDPVCYGCQRTDCQHCLAYSLLHRCRIAVSATAPSI